MADHSRLNASEETVTGPVLRFRPRTSTTLPRHAPIITSGVEARDPDDFRHRMLVNVAGLACAATLAAAGVWLASSIADLRRTQDCVISGRRDCAPIMAVKHEAVAPRQH